MKYQLYTNGIEFLKENEFILYKDLKSKIQTAFISLNAMRYLNFDLNNYAFKFYDEKNVLLLLKVEPYNALLYGSEELIEFAVDTIINYNLELTDLLGEDNLTRNFINAYQKKQGGKMEEYLSMQILILDKTPKLLPSSVFRCDKKDLTEVAIFYKAFVYEALNETRLLEEIETEISPKIHNFYVLKINGKIVSMACKTRETKEYCSISGVYTDPVHRGKGYANLVVSKLSFDILNENKVAYLFVDCKNPISNHLYLKIGYKPLVSQLHLKYKKQEV